MPKPVCVKCQREMKPEKNGVGYVETADFGPCAVWDADLWKCHGCGIEILHGFGRGAVVHHWEGERFARILSEYEERSILIHERRWQDDSREGIRGKATEDRAVAGEQQSGK